jgi:Uma2 family endonuclease
MSTLAREIYQPHRYTVDEYYRMAESGILNEKSRVELIEGEVIDMPPIGSPHSGLVNILSHRLGRAAGDSAIVAVQNPVRLNHFSEPEPDIALLRPRPDFYTSAHPTPNDVFLIVEVSDSTLRYDRDIKTPLYAKHGIPEVWLVDVAGRELAIHRLPEKSGYTDIQRPTGREPIGLVALPEVKVDLSGLFG